MNAAEVRRVLVTYRPGAGDRADPEVAEALIQVERDPDLAQWLERQVEFHRSVRTELRAIPIPSGLKARILTQEKVVVPIWRRREFLLLAACFAFALGLAALWLKGTGEDRSFAGFRSRMVGFAGRVYRMDIVSTDATQVREYLKGKGAPADYALTRTLQAIPTKGGASLSWQTNPVSMVCFSLPEDETLYLFVMEAKCLKEDIAPGPKPVLERVRGMTTASWSSEGKVYLVAASDAQAIAKHFQ